jgi:hypothetical protein
VDKERSHTSNNSTICLNCSESFRFSPYLQQLLNLGDTTPQYCNKAFCKTIQVTIEANKNTADFDANIWLD